MKENQLCKGDHDPTPLLSSVIYTTCLKSFKIQSNLPNKEGKGTEQIARIGGVSVLLIGHDYGVTYTIPQTVFKYIVTKTGAHFDLLGRCLTEEQNQSYKAIV